MAICVTFVLHRHIQVTVVRRVSQLGIVDQTRSLKN